MNMMYSFSSRINPVCQPPATVPAIPAKSTSSPRVTSWSRISFCLFLVFVVNFIYGALTTSVLTSCIIGPESSARAQPSTLPLFGEVQYRQPPLSGAGQYCPMPLSGEAPSSPMPLSGEAPSSPMPLSGEVPQYLIGNILERPTLTNSDAVPYSTVITYGPAEIASNIDDDSASTNVPSVVGNTFLHFMYFTVKVFDKQYLRYSLRSLPYLRSCQRIVMPPTSNSSLV